MNIQELINNDIKNAMLAREAQKLAALRAVKSAIMLEATKDGKSEVSDEVVLKIISRLVKQRRDSAQIYNEQNRQDLEQDELEELKHLEVYLPKQLSKDAVEKIIDMIILDLGTCSSTDMGKVMGLAINKLRGQADGKLISTLVKEKLQ
jgi:uncharacterized protein YqeY|tara:strand:- start:3618 stop:4064 length:447 start_codon:yes stop_codon:yes gene_type:complete